MTKVNDEHPTTEQLSAFLDQQLSPQEQAVFDAHIRTCQQCQQTLANLRQTVSLLHRLPQVEVPRSFALPTRIAPVPVPQRPTHEIPTPSHRRRAWRYAVQRSVRAVSAIAAVLGLIFILSGVIVGLPHGAGGVASNAVPSSSSAGSTGNHSLNPSAHPPTVISKPNGQGATRVPSTQIPTPTPMPGATDQIRKSPHSTPAPHPAQPLPAALDLNQPAGHLEIGSLLLVLGILGIALTRRRYTA